MPINWDDVNRELFPIKNYEDMCRRLKGSFSYGFVRETYNFSMPELVAYTQSLLGGDARGRYHEYMTRLTGILAGLDKAGVTNLQDLIAKVETHEQFEDFTKQSGLLAQDVAMVLKYLIFWFIPMEKYLSGLVRDDPGTKGALKVLSGLGIRTNLQLLQQGITPGRRKALADASDLPEAVILSLVNLADFSRMPWASKATIANIIGAGCGSLAQLAKANPEQLYANFFRYGETIGKNLKFGNEIESSHRVAKILPVLLQAG